MKACIFDIDGTLANCDHRLHHLDGDVKDWHSFFAAQADDKPIDAVVWLNQLLASAQTPSSDYAIIIVTARPEQYSTVTDIWLGEHDIMFDRVYMRKENDHRPDQIVKAEILEQILADGYEPWLVIDDRPQVVEMWRSFGITTLQCAPDEPVRNNYEGQHLLDILIGPAGAGKTTYCEKHYKPHEIISTDAIREENGWGQHPDDRARTFKYAHALIKARLENGLRTVFDATNLKLKDRAKVVKLIPRGQMGQYILIDRDYDEKVKHRGWRPEELISQHHKTMKSTVPFALNADGFGNILVKDARK